MQLYDIYPIGRMPFWKIKESQYSTVEFGNLFWWLFRDSQAFSTLFEEGVLEAFLVKNPTYRIFIGDLENATHTFEKSREVAVDPVELFDAHLVYYRCILILESIYDCGIQMIGDHPFSFDQTPALLFRFFEKYIENIPLPNLGDIWCFHVHSPGDIYQLDAILIAMKKRHPEFRAPHIFFILRHLLEFEDKETLSIEIEAHVGKQYAYTILRSDSDYQLLVSQHATKKVCENKWALVFGKSFWGISFFSSGCFWRKCTFCNIGKTGNIYAKKRAEKEEIVRKNIQFLLENQYDAASILDPSIPLDDLLLIARVFEEEHFSIPLHVRTRYDRRYSDPKNCEKLAAMGVRYLGVGLESASPRVNRLMNKYVDDPTPEDFDVMTSNCLDAGIRIHHYVILGFPGETREELDATRDYLLRCSSRFRDQFYTYTSGMFDMSYGTDVSDNPEKYGISLIAPHKIKDAKIHKPYIEHRLTPALEKYQYRTSFNLFAYQFFGTVLIEKDHRWMSSLWGFIERFDILRMQKFFLDKNPYDPQKMQDWLRRRGLLTEE